MLVTGPLLACQWHLMTHTSSVNPIWLYFCLLRALRVFFFLGLARAVLTITRCGIFNLVFDFDFGLQLGNNGMYDVKKKKRPSLNGWLP